VLDLVKTIVKVSGRPDLEPEVRAERPPEDDEFLSAQRAKQVLGWEPEYTLEAGLAETYAWYEQHSGADLEARATGG
jgi:nucleoside-diphosphate-sugar epimerase